MVYFVLCTQLSSFMVADCVFYTDSLTVRVPQSILLILLDLGTTPPSISD